MATGPPGQLDAPSLGVFEDVRCVLREVWTEGATIEAALERNDEAAALAAVHAVLAHIYDWSDNGKLRAYLYAWTGETLTEEAVRKDKHEVFSAIEKCAEIVLSQPAEA